MAQSISLRESINRWSDCPLRTEPVMGNRCTQSSGEIRAIRLGGLAVILIWRLEVIRHSRANVLSQKVMVRASP